MISNILFSEKENEMKFILMSSKDQTRLKGLKNRNKRHPYRNRGVGRGPMKTDVLKL